MSARVLKGRPVADKVQNEVAERTAALAQKGKPVGLGTVMVGDDPASEVYLGTKHKAAQRCGMKSFGHHLPTDTPAGEILELIDRLNADPAIDGMIVQLPLPESLDAMGIVAEIDPAKDADGLHPYNLGLLAAGRPGPVPATPQGIAEILDFYDIDVAGRTVVVVGRSLLVGRPLGLLLNARGTDATVVMAHSATPDLPSVCRWGDVLVAATGRPGLITADFVKEGAVVVDVGITRTKEGLKGDVAFEEVASKASAVTPVPGGVGPMTVACLLRNTVAAAERFAEVG